MEKKSSWREEFNGKFILAESQEVLEHPTDVQSSILGGKPIEFIFQLHFLSILILKTWSVKQEEKANSKGGVERARV